MNRDQNTESGLTEVEQALAELLVTRNFRYDKQDLLIWMDRLEEHNHSGLTTEAARRFGEDDSLQDVPLTLASFIRVVKQIRTERIKAMEDRFPQPPSNIGDREYRLWLQVRNECAVRGFSPEQIDQASRRAINAPAPEPISSRPAPVLYLPPSPSAPSTPSQ